MNMTIQDIPTGTKPPKTNAFRFKARDITGTFELDMEVPRGISAGRAAELIANRMELEPDAYALRHDSSGQLLKDDQALDTQSSAASEPSFTLTPKAHLGVVK